MHCDIELCVMTLGQDHDITHPLVIDKNHINVHRNPRCTYSVLSLTWILVMFATTFTWTNWTSQFLICMYPLVVDSNCVKFRYSKILIDMEKLWQKQEFNYMWTLILNYELWSCVKITTHLRSWSTIVFNFIQTNIAVRSYGPNMGFASTVLRHWPWGYDLWLMTSTWVMDNYVKYYRDPKSQYRVMASETGFG